MAAQPVPTGSQTIAVRRALTVMFVICCCLLILFPSRIGLMLRYGFGSTILFSIIIYAFVYSQQNTLGRWAGFLAAMALPGFTLLALWMNGRGEMQVLGGGIFFSDTFLLFSEANSLLDGGSFVQLAARRPLFSSFFSSFLLLTGRNLQLALILLVAVNALSIYWIVKEIRKTEGILAAVILSLMLFLFYRRFIGTPDTENFGFVFGVTGAALLWKDKHTGHLLGLFLITLALLGRAGAFVVIPCILIWIVSLQETRRKQWITLMSGGLIVVSAVLSNTLLSKIVSKSSGTLFANFSETLYGISVGGKGWQQAYRDFPDLISIPENERFGILYRLAVSNISNDPRPALRAIAFTWVDYFSLRAESIFGFASGGDLIFRDQDRPDLHGSYIVWRVLLYGLSVAGLIHCWKNRQQPGYRLVLWCLVGILLSMPLLPPGDSALMRVHAGTITFLAALPAIGCGSLLHSLCHGESAASTQVSTDRSGDLLTCFGSLLIVAALVVPLFIKQFSKQPIVSAPHCPAGSVDVVVRIIPGSVVNILEEESSPTASPLSITRNMFQNSIDEFPHRDAIGSLAGITPPKAIASVFDVRTRDYFWMIIDGPFLVQRPELVAACGTWDQEMLGRGLKFLETSNLSVLQP